MLQRKALVAIGGNLPGPDGRSALATCRWAVHQVAVLTGLRLLACSRWYRSTPVPPSGQPDYVNGVALYEGEAEPQILLDHLHRVEAEAGRVRGVVNAARQLDLDLLAMGDRVIHSPTLTLPHPRLTERAFVLAPLCDVLPRWITQGGSTAAALLSAMDKTGIDVIQDD